LNLERKILRQNLAKHYAKLDQINCKLKILHDQLFLKSRNPIQLDQRINDTIDDVKLVGFNKFSRLKRKLRNLVNKKVIIRIDSTKHYSDHIFHDRVKNLSTTSFTLEELDLLGLGFKFTIRDMNDSKENNMKLAIEVDIALDYLSNNIDKKFQLRNEIYSILSKSQKRQHSNKKHNTVYHKKTLQRIKRKIKNDNLIITKADKGNCIVILRREDYNKKVTDFLTNNNFVTLEHSPFSKFIKKLNTYIKAHNEFLQEFEAPKSLIPSNPSIPKLYGLPKLHKPEIPIRPIVSFINTPASILCTFIQKLLLNLTKFKPRFSISNSLELVNKIQQLDIDNSIGANLTMSSYDIINLYTSIPTNELPPIISNILRQSNINENLIVNILTILNFCLSQNFFIFNNKFYEQPIGLAMGNPLSPLMANIYMDYIEQNYIMKIQSIKYWFRYVDDCLVFTNGTIDDLKNTSILLNAIHPNIKFTNEPEIDGKLNFLDLSLSRKDDKIEFGIYRKDTQTDHVIHSTSNSPFQHKMAAFNCYVYRLLTLPLSITNYKKEVNILKQIAVNNGYNENIVQNIIEKTERKMMKEAASKTLNTDNNTAEIKYISLPFVNEKTNRSINRILTREFPNIRISHNSNFKMGSVLINSKDPTRKLDKSGVYKLECSDCKASYIGRTCRSLNTRIKEHIKQVDKSSMGHHLKFNKHNLSPNTGSKLLHNITSKNFLRLDLYEDLEIMKELKNNNLCLNQQVQFDRFIPIHRRLMT